MRFEVVNLGCKVNRVESDSISAELESLGWTFDSAAPQAIVVNTCTVTGEAQKKTRKCIRQCIARHPEARIIVTGCAAVVAADELLGIDDRVEVVSKASVIDALGAAGSDLGDWGSGALRVGSDFPTRVGLKIQDGCDNACTYCIVHTARGRSRSRCFEDVRAEARRLQGAGVREIVLTGINLGRYRDADLDLVGLLDELLRSCPEVRFRLSSIEPCDVTDGLLRLMERSQGKICRHLHLPLQSGSDAVLRQMARPYSFEDYFTLVCKARELMPSLALSTDVIVGFPGETEEDFDCTLSAVRLCRFSKVHVFRYSRRDGTPAALRCDQVDPSVVSHRAHELQVCADAARKADALSRVGTCEDLVVERDGLAMAESYYSVRVPPAWEAGVSVRGALTEFGQDGIFSL